MGDRSNVDGKQHEPIEDVIIECEEEHAGAIIESMTHRKAEVESEILPVSCIQTGSFQGCVDLWAARRQAITLTSLCRCDSLHPAPKQLTEMVPVPESAGRMKLCFDAPSRGLLGYRLVTHGFEWPEISFSC